MTFIFQKYTGKCLLLYTAILSINTIWAQTRVPGVTPGVSFFSKVITIQAVLSKEDMLDISPIQVKRYTMIKWPATDNRKLTITMFDANGRFVLCRQYQLRKGENELLLTNLEAQPAGVYFIKASDGVSYRNGKLRIQQ
jgi:hypothetical protein